MSDFDPSHWDPRKCDIKCWFDAFPDVKPLPSRMLFLGEGGYPTYILEATAAAKRRAVHLVSTHNTILGKPGAVTLEDANLLMQMAVSALTLSILLQNGLSLTTAGKRWLYLKDRPVPRMYLIRKGACLEASAFVKAGFDPADLPSWEG